MTEHEAISVGQAAFWQTATAVVQAVVSVALLGWYVLAAHLDRVRTRREQAEDFSSLVTLCRDLGIEAKSQIEAHLRAATDTKADSTAVTIALRERFISWKTEMTVIYVCLNEVPHYEVRNPTFSTALTRLWMAVDVRAVDANKFAGAEQFITCLNQKLDRICVEVDAMAELLRRYAIAPRHSLSPRGRAGRRGKSYTEAGFVQEETTSL